MSNAYIPLYRKYRPQTFQDTIGQEHITKALANAIKLNKVAHAYLFCGPRGTGKTSTARIFAKSLNCENGPTTEPCGKCPSCIDITNATPVDVIEIDAASNRSVEDTQNIIEKVQYVPIHGKYKIYIIDEVHMLSTTAFNSLLKTLEEPPKNVIFILATTEAHKVLETIVSRCQRFDFRRITVDDIVKRLEYISEQENINISKDALIAIAKYAQGGMRDALALLDQLSILSVQKQIDVEDVENILGKISVNILYNLTEKIILNNAQEAVLEINKIYEKGNEPIQIITNYIEYFRNLLIVKNCKEQETIATLTQLNNENIEKLQQQAEKLEITKINYVIDRLANYLREIKNSNDKYLWLEICVIELANKLSEVGFSDLIGRVEALEKAVSGEVQFAKQQSQKQPIVHATIKPQIQTSQEQQLETDIPQQIEEATKDNTLDRINKPEQENKVIEEQTQPISTQPTNDNEMELWNSLLANISSLPSQMFFTNLSTPILLTPDKVVIGFKKEVFVKQSKESSKMSYLKDALTVLFGHADMPIEIKLITEEEASNVKKKTTIAPPTQQISPPPKDSKQDSSSEEDDEEYYEQKLTEARESKHPTPPNHSDQAKMILDLFNGKYMD